MNCKIGTMIVGAMLKLALTAAPELPSERELAEIRSQRSGAEMRAKAMPVILKIWEVRRSSVEDEKCELDRRMSNAFLDAPPSFGVVNVSLTLRTHFLKMMPEFVALQPDARLWDALANHLRAAAYIPKNAFDGKMAEAKAKDERLIAEGKITRPPCHFGYPNTPNMAVVQREKWAAEKWNTDVARYRLALLKKYAPLFSKCLKALDEMKRAQFRCLFSKRANLTPGEEQSLFGVVSEQCNANESMHKLKEAK